MRGVLKTGNAERKPFIDRKKKLEMIAQKKEKIDSTIYFENTFKYFST